MRRPHLPPINKSGLANAVVAMSGGSVAAGVWLEYGASWGLVTGGVLGAAFGLFLVDVDDEETS